MLDPDLLRETEDFLHAQIPLTRAMGVRVESYDGATLVLWAPLALNHNHLGTAFGGSLAALATLAGYGLLWLELQDCAIHIVIRESSTSYLRPLRGELRALCRRPPAPALEQFRADLQRKGKARVRLEVTVENDGETAVRFEGSFVALKPPA